MGTGGFPRRRLSLLMERAQRGIIECLRFSFEAMEQTITGKAKVLAAYDLHKGPTMKNGEAKSITVTKSQAYNLVEQVANDTVRELTIQNMAHAASNPELDAQAVDYEECRKQLINAYLDILRVRGLIKEKN